MVATKKKTTKKKKKDETQKEPEKLYYCSGCGQEKKKKDFYKNTSNPNSEILAYCKECCVDKSLDDYTLELDMNKFQDMLRVIDKPFLYDEFTTIAKKYDNPKSIIGSYLRVLALPQTKGLRNKDSIYEPKEVEVDEDGEIMEEDPLENNNGIYDKEEWKRLKRKWGARYKKSQIEYLENFYNKILENKPDKPTAVDEDYMIKVCKTSLLADEALESGNVAQYEKYMKIVSNLNNSLKLEAVQRNATDNIGGLATFSEFFAKLESEGFIEPTKVTEDYDIVEKTIADMKNYYRRLVLGDSSIQTMVDAYGDKLREDSLKNDDNKSIEEDIEYPEGFTPDDNYDESYYL